MKAYIADLAAYNDGRLVGEWIELDGKDGDALREEVNGLLAKWTRESGELREEYAVHDWDMVKGWDNCNECPDWDKVVEFVAACDEHGEDIVSAALQCDIPLDKIGEAFRGEYDSETDYAERYADDTGILSEIPENLRYYFNFEAFGRDMFIDDVQGVYIDGNLYVFDRNW